MEDNNYLLNGCGRYTTFYNYIKSIPMPLKEEYETLEEYNKAFNEYLIFILDSIVEVKEGVFKTALNQYNDMLTASREHKEDYNDLITKTNTLLEGRKNLKKGLYLAIILASISVPILALIDILVLLLVNVSNKTITTSLERYEYILGIEEQEMNKFYDLINVFREDYHKTIKILKTYLELVKKDQSAHTGDEEFVNEIIETIKPINIGFDNETCTKVEEVYQAFDEIVDQMLSDIVDLDKEVPDVKHKM